MVLKRYTPKYKILAKLRQALWLNKRSKIKKFKKQKWDGKVRIYFPRKTKVFDQDSATSIVGKGFDSDRIVRLKKTYKYMLQDKQAFQLYYGARRLKLYQLKRFAACARRMGPKKRVSSSKMLFHFMESRLEIGLYRLAFVSSLMQSRKLLSSGCIKVNDKIVRGFGFNLKIGSYIHLDDFRSNEVLARYLKFNVPFFYFKRKEKRRRLLFSKKELLSSNILVREKVPFFNFLKSRLFLVDNLKKNLKVN